MTTRLFRAHSTGSVDKFGVVASCLCTCHCVVMPFLLAGVGLPIPGIHNEQFEHGMVAMSAVVAFGSVGFATLRHHRRVIPMLLVAFGLLCLVVLRRLFHEGSIGESATTVLGGASMVTAHVRNHALMCKGTCCDIHRVAELGVADEQPIPLRRKLHDT